MRCMDDTKLVYSIKLPPKSCQDALTAINKMLTSGLEIYLNIFVSPFVGDWPMLFFIRQLVYSFLSGKNAKLAKRPKPWRVSLFWKLFMEDEHLSGT